MRKTSFVLLMCFAAAACTVGPDYVKPGRYSDNVIKRELALKKGVQPAKNWYALFGDDDLNRLIDLGLQNSTDIEIAVARLKQARASLQISRAAFLPQINGSGGYNYQKNSKNIGPTADSRYYTAGFDASWEFDLWGKGRRQDEAAEAQLKAETYTLNNVKTVVAAELAANYINMKLSAEKLRIARQNLALQKDIFSTVSSPIFAGSYRYNTKALYALPAEVIRNRPDVAAAEQNLIAQNALVGAAVADLYPDVSVSALWGYAASGGNNLFNSQSQGYSYEPLISVPLLDWNRLQNQVEKQKAQKEEALAQYKKSVLSAVAELKNAMTAVQNELKSNQAQNNAVVKMNKVVSASAERYRNGLIEFSDFLTMEQNRLQAQNNSLQSRAQVFQNLVAYYKACGGGYLL